MVLPSDATRIVLRGDFNIVDDARLTDVFTAVSDAERIVRIAKVDRVVEIQSGDRQEKHTPRSREVVLVGGWS